MSWLESGGLPEQQASLTRIAVPLQARLGGDAPNATWSAVRLLAELDAAIALDDEDEALMWRSEIGPLIFVVGDPGSGKTTVTALVAQVFRDQLLGDSIDSLPDAPAVHRVRSQLRELISAVEIERSLDVVPLRINLPRYASWCVQTGRDASTVQSAWDFTAWMIANDTDGPQRVALTGQEAKALVASAGRREYWLLDSLDEVPRGSQRRAATTLAHALLGETLTRAVVVTARPDSYEENSARHSLLRLEALDANTGISLVKRMLCALNATDDCAALVSDENRPDWLVELVRTPLHAAMLASVLTTDVALPSRWHLLDRYVDITFRRESKKYAVSGSALAQPKDTLLQLHRKLALSLHTRAQLAASARISARQLDEQLTALLVGAGDDPETIAATVARLSEFTRERLMFLLRVEDDSFSFGIQSLQEFFAAEELRCGADTDVLVRRIEAIVLNPHWRQVVAFVASALLASAEERARFDAAFIAVLERARAGSDDRAKARLAPVAAVQLCAAVQGIEARAAQAKLWSQALAVYDDDFTLAGDYRRALQDERERGVTHYGRAPVGAESILGGAFKRGRGQERVAEAARRSSAMLAELLATRGVEAAMEAMKWGAVALGNASELHAVRDEVVRRAVDEKIDPARWLSLARMGTGRVISEPIVEQLMRGPDHFSPGQFLRARWDKFWLEAYARRVPWLSCLMGLGLVKRLSRIAVTEVGALGIDLLKLKNNTHFARSFVEQAPQGTALWRGWRSLFEFERSSTRDNLEAVINALRVDGLLSEAARHQSFSWVIGAVLRAVALSDPSSVLNLLSSGRLGDVSDWIEAEGRFATSAGVFAEHVELVRAARPWSEDIARAGEPLSDQYVWRVTSAFAEQQRAACEAIAPLVIDRSWRVRNFATQLLLSFDDLSKTRALPTLELARAREILSDARDVRSGLLIDRVRLDLTDAPGEWGAVLDELARNDLIGAIGNGPRSERDLSALDTLYERVASIAADHPALGGLLDLQVLLLTQGATHTGAKHKLPDVAADRSPDVRAAHAVLMLLDDEHRSLDGAVIAALPVGYQEALVRIAERSGRVSLGRREAIRDAVFEHGAFSLRPWLQSRRMRAALDALEPAFATPEAWEAHGFSGVFPMRSVNSEVPVKVATLVELSGFRIFARTPRVSTPFVHGPPAEGQWLVLLGENGVGKTTMLRAFALALIDPVVGTQLLGKSRSGAFRRNGAAARVELALSGARYAVRIETGERETESVVQDGEAPAWRPWVVAYGVSRGNALGERDREVVRGPFGDVHTLFEEPPSLHRAASWLYRLRGAVSKEIELQLGRNSYDPARPGPAAQTWNTVHDVLCNLLGVDKITRDDVVEDRLWVEGESLGVGRVRFDALSDGYLSFSGWSVDLIARWIDFEREQHREVREGFNRRMTGVVLIDELDMHLHPVWQMNVMDRVRSLFPRMTFIVTTHNPLMLQGARPGEVYIVRRDGGDIELVQRDVQPGSDIDRVLFEQFGVLDTFDKRTRELIIEHRRLMATEESGRDNARLEVLNRELSKRLSIVAELAYQQRERVLRGDDTPLSDDEQAWALAQLTGDAGRG